jgi:EVE domain
MTYWLDLFTPFTWTRFREHGADISGFRPRQRKTAVGRIKSGDRFLCYVVRLQRWCGVLEVSGAAFEDTTPIFADSNDPFSIRFNVSPVVTLDFEHSIPIAVPDLWTKLSFTKGLVAGSAAWAQAQRMRQSLVQISEPDGDLICRLLQEQTAAPKAYELDSADRRHIAQRTVVRTETGEVEVEVPEREETKFEPVESEREVRASIQMQANVVRLGAILGFNVWLPPSDRTRVSEALPAQHRDKLVTTLPLNYDTATLKTIENIDVIWLERRSIAHAFEVEHTTAIYSGLLRMADLLALQPRIQISLHIVAPASRREQVRREIVRPVFSVLEGGAMAERCSFLSYDALDGILQQPNLRHARETILEDYEEFFDAS